MELTTEIRQPKAVNPNMMIIYSVPKAGKTKITSMLPNHLILELEPGGADYISGRVQEISKASEFDEVVRLIQTSPTKVCDYLIVDTISRLDEWSEIVGTYNYMNKSQGKKFNREGDKEGGQIIYHTDPRFESVHSIGQGYGYAHSREAMVVWYDRLLYLVMSGKVGHVILLAHVKDKLVESRNGDSVESIDISLTGKVKSIYSSKVDAVGHFYREKGKGYISFDNEYKVVCGGRCPHLTGSILISEKDEKGEVITHWNNIFLNNK